MTCERAELLNEIKDLKWEKDQQFKVASRGVEAQADRAEKEKLSYLKHIENLKSEVFENFQSELAAKTAENLRIETLYQQRIHSLEKEVARVEVLQVQSSKLEEDLRLKVDLLQ